MPTRLVISARGAVLRALQAGRADALTIVRDGDGIGDLFERGFGSD
jgi:hypothetical protein